MLKFIYIKWLLPNDRDVKKLLKVNGEKQNQTCTLIALVFTLRSLMSNLPINYPSLHLLLSSNDLFPKHSSPLPFPQTSPPQSSTYILNLTLSRPLTPHSISYPTLAQRYISYTLVFTITHSIPAFIPNYPISYYSP